jgi:hypothetical protein
MPLQAKFWQRVWSRRTKVQTIKTAVVVVLLLVVLYGAYIAINGSQTELPPELQKMLATESELEVDVSLPGLGSSPGATFQPSAGLSPSQGLTSSSGLPSGSGSFWNSQDKPTSSPTASPETLTPPKLTSIPDFPGTSGTASSSLATPAAPAPLKSADTAKVDSQALANPTGGPTDLAPPSLAQRQGAPQSSLSPPPAAPAGESAAALAGKLTSQTSPSVAATPELKKPEELPLAQQPSPALARLPSEPVEPLAEAAPLKKANLTGRSFDNAKKTAMEMIDRNEFKEALATLSVFYNSPELSSEQSQDLLNLLDSLAAETIYSRRHLLDTPYVVGPGENIADIAARYEIPAELLARINAIDPTLGPTPGTKLKVFPGPFRAEVDVQRNEMTLFLGELYAGRFPISTGADPQPKEGVYQVLDKQRQRNYYGKGGIQIDGSDPRNPYGGWWIDIGQELSIHGSPSAQASESNGLGCISLSPLDAGDVYAMLSRGSQVTIKR